MQHLRQSLSERGFAVLDDATPGLLNQIGMELGRVVLQTDVRVAREARAMVFSSEPIEWHQDSTEARWMAWFCIDPGADSSEVTEILPLDEIVKELSAEQQSYLSEVKVADRLSDGREILRPLFNGQSLYFCPWLIQTSPSSSSNAAVIALKKQISQKSAKAHRQSWRRGQILIVDNHRCLHRRPRLKSNSQRHLVRLWIAELS